MDRNKGRYKSEGKYKNEERGSMSTRPCLDDLLGNVAFIRRYEELEPKTYVPIANEGGKDAFSLSREHRQAFFILILT